jgi:HK97 family phage major capsid protein
VFMESKAFADARERGFDGPVRIHAGVEGKSIYNFSGGSVSHQALGHGGEPRHPRRRQAKSHIRDLFPKSSTKSSVLYGVRETGWVNNAAQVNQRYAADGVSPATGADTDVWGPAPKSKITLTPVMFPVAGIKHSLDAHKHILSDEPRLRTFLNGRMLDGVKYAEDYDLLHSVGSGEQITGLFNTPGVQTYTGLNSDKYDVQVRRSITKALLAEYEPTGLVLSPTMWEAVEITQTTTGEFRVAVSVAIGAEKRIWRLNVVETTAMDDTKFLVGAFGMGAQLHDREAVSVSVSTEHATNYTDGVVTFLAEERVAFEVNRPESFVIGTWTTPV